MFLCDNQVPPVKDWIKIAYSLYKEYTFKLFKYNLIIILSKRK